MIKYMLITNDPHAAVYAESCGVKRIFVDLERHGKFERQGHLDTLISRHSIEDVAKVKKQLLKADLLVRLNPLHADSEQEVEQAIDAGADLLMLPMFRTANEVRLFCDLVADRVAVVPLVETYEATQALVEIVHVSGVSEIYIGLNDLHLDMKLNFMFEPLANGLVEQMTNTIKSVGLPFGFGGIARVGEGVIPGEMVLGEHLRLGSSAVILSRTFHRRSEGLSDFQANLDLKVEMDKLLAKVDELSLRNEAEINADQQRFQTKVREFAASRAG